MLSYQKLDNKELGTGKKLCVKNPSRSGVIKIFPTVTSQKPNNISWEMYNFKRKRLHFLLDFLNCSSKLYHNLLQYVKFKKI